MIWSGSFPGHKNKMSRLTLTEIVHVRDELVTVDGERVTTEFKRAKILARFGRYTMVFYDQEAGTMNVIQAANLDKSILRVVERGVRLRGKEVFHSFIYFLRTMVFTVDDRLNFSNFDEALNHPVLSGFSSDEWIVVKFKELADFLRAGTKEEKIVLDKAKSLGLIKELDMELKNKLKEKVFYAEGYRN